MSFEYFIYKLIYIYLIFKIFNKNKFLKKKIELEFKQIIKFYLN